MPGKLDRSPGIAASTRSKLADFKVSDGLQSTIMTIENRNRARFPIFEAYLEPIPILAGRPATPSSVEY
ncbi:MAG: hypothetical protein GY788_15395 [bacterium]|nr:hypothetical protein [bacterium]